MWKHEELEPVPVSLDAQREEVSVINDRVKFTSKGQEVDLYYQKCSPSSDDKNIQVLLLHGMRFNSQTWVDLGTMQVLAALGYTALAVDLPGYGESKEAEVHEDTGLFLADLIGALQLDRPVIISPSLSGCFSLPFLLEKNPEDWQSKASGYIPIAPIFTDNFTEDLYKKCQIPTLIVQGSKDIPMGSIASQHLGNLPNSHLYIMQDCGHPCYMDKPEEWHQVLYNFMKTISK